MNVKELSEFTGKTERAVQKWIKKASEKSSSVNEKSSSSSPNSPADYNIDEVETILNCSSLGTNAVLIVMANARKNQEKKEVVSQDDSAFKIMAVAFDRLTRITESQENRISNIENKIEERKAILPAPSISPRQNITKIVREYAVKEEKDFRDVYRELYRDFSYRYHMDIEKRAKNRDMAKMDYIETEGLIENLEAVAIDLFA